MFIDTDSIVINGVSMGQYLLYAKFGYHKIWGEDSGRNLAFETVGTLGGIFPKITLTFKRLKASEITIIAPILDSAIQTTVYKNTDGTTKTMSTYTGDWEIVFKDMNKGESFDCSVISRSKRV